MTRGNGSFIGAIKRPSGSDCAGIWSVSEAQQGIGSKNWYGMTPYAPNTPAITSVTATTPGQADVSWVLGYDGGSTITKLTIVSIPGNIVKIVNGPTSTGTTTVTGLTNGATYAFQITATNSVGTSDPNSSGTVTIPTYYSLLMHFDGANNSTTFTDATGLNTFSVSGGSPVISTAQSKFGGSSMLCAPSYPGAATSIKTANNARFAPGTGAFTVEGWVYSTGQGGFQSWFSTRTSAGYAQAIFFGLSGSNVVLYASVPLITSSMTLPTNQWVHVAISKPGGAGTTVYMYVDGVYAGQVTGALDFSEQGCSLGGTEYGGSGVYPFVGYIDEFRMLKGQGIYSGTSNITVPTTPFT